VPLIADLIAVLLFVILGRGAHDEGGVVLGTLSTAWPFLAGALAGWGAVAATRLPGRSRRAGLLVAAGVVVVGMLLRHLVQHDGTPASFVVVATVVNVAFLVGWRAALVRLARRAAPARSL
jgi:Protein of unknown function (DUF3054)